MDYTEENTKVSITQQPKTKMRQYLSRRLHVTVPLIVYSITAFMFLPIFQSLIYKKVCVQNAHFIGFNISDCQNRSLTSKNTHLQTRANHVQLISTVLLSLSGMTVAPFVGRLGDTKSPKLAILVPFFGLLLEDITLLIQSHWLHETSVYFLVVSEFIFGIFGGYMTILSTNFAFCAHLRSENEKEKSKMMGLLEGCLGIGGTIGLLLTGITLKTLDYANTFLLFTFLHIFCILYVVLCLEDIDVAKKRKKSDTNNKRKGEIGEIDMRRRFRDYLTETIHFSISGTRNCLASQRRALIYILAAFGLSFFVYMGSVHILFYYLKHRLEWDAEMYGYLKGSLHAAATLMALFGYPLLKRANVSDITLALIGLVSRLSGRLWLALVWSTSSAFILVFCDMFSRFGAAALRSLMSQQVDNCQQGKVFALVAVLEGLCNLLASLIFNNLFPLTIDFLPQTSYLIMTAIMTVPILFIIKADRLIGKSKECLSSDNCPDLKVGQMEEVQ